MRKLARLSVYIVIFIGLALVNMRVMANSAPTIPENEALKIAVKIWYNESGGNVTGLTAWKVGENFASMGIGHFTWYPAGKNAVFSDGFPQLIKYMEDNGVTVPTWLQGTNIPPCPWHTRGQFLAAQYSPNMVELREFLLATVGWQARFMAYRMQRALPRILASVPPEEQPYFKQQFDRLAKTPLGIYALVDYVNFKGDGANLGYGYSPQGWGLLQVIAGMRYAPENWPALQAFAWSADEVLTRRVANAPSYRDEGRWLAGWRNRIKTYLT